jgi:hypothetical protein
MWGKPVRKNLLVLSFGLFLVSPMAAYADGDQPVTPAAPAAAPATTGATETVVKTGQEVVCKRLEAATGSRLGGRRVCKTAEQWRQDQQTTYETMQNLQQWQSDQATNGARPGGH